MAKYDTKAKTTYTRPEPDTHKQDWKRDRYAQRDAKVTARRNITGGVLMPVVLCILMFACAGVAVDAHKRDDPSGFICAVLVGLVLLAVLRAVAH